MHIVPGLKQRAQLSGAERRNLRPHSVGAPRDHTFKTFTYFTHQVCDLDDLKIHNTGCEIGFFFISIKNVRMVE